MTKLKKIIGKTGETSVEAPEKLLLLQSSILLYLLVLLTEKGEKKL